MNKHSDVTQTTVPDHLGVHAPEKHSSDVGGLGGLDTIKFPDAPPPPPLPAPVVPQAPVGSPIPSEWIEDPNRPPEPPIDMRRTDETNAWDVRDNGDGTKSCGEPTAVERYLKKHGTLPIPAAPAPPMSPPPMVKPHKSLEMLKQDFVAAATIAEDRFSILELTHIELKLRSEMAQLVSFATHETITFAKQSQLASCAFRHYTAALEAFIAKTDNMFDGDQRLKQPYYRKALQSTSVRLMLNDRENDEAAAFLFVESIRIPPTAPQGEKPTFIR